MRLASVEADNRKLVVAEAADGRLVDVNAVATDDALTMLTLVEAPESARGSLLERVAVADDQFTVDTDTVTWLPPVRRPSKIVGVALNNDVFNYLAARTMTAPMYFLTPPSAMIGHNAAIELDPTWGLVHPEPELAAVIGTTLRRATPEEAVAGVFGYTIINDITSPGIKSDDSVELVMPQGISVDEPWRTMRGDDDRSLYLTYHARSKGTDTFAPIGPWIVPAEELPDPDRLAVRSYLDGDLVLEDSTANLTFAIPDVLSHLSQSMTLLAGDIVHFGTAARPAQPERFATIRSIDLTRFGHTVSIEIDGLGRIDNSIDRTIGTEITGGRGCA